MAARGRSSGEHRSPVARRSLLFAGLTLILAAMLVAAAAEAGLRLAYGKIERLTGVAEWEPGRWETLTYHWDAYDPRLGWTNLPGYRSDERVPFAVTINGQGLRADRDYAPRAPEGLQRVAVFGDSCTFGEEVDDDQTLPYYLERMLERTEALNFGVRGYGLDQMVLRLEEPGLAFHPDLALFVVLLPEDVGRVISDRFGHAKPFFRLDGERLVLENVPVPEASRLPWILRRSFVAAWLRGRTPGAPAVVTLEENAALAEAILARLRSTCAAAGLPCLLVPIVTAGTLDRIARDPGERERLAYLRAALGRSGLEVFDAVDFLERELADGGDVLVAPHGHWSAEGNRRLAAWIARRLIERYGAER
jgi:hypothetical protein